MIDGYSYVIWGSSGHAKVLGDILGANKGKVLAFFDNQEMPSALAGVPIYLGESGFLKWVKGLEGYGKVAGLIAIGGAKGRDRLAILKLFREHSLHLPSLTHPSAIVSTSALVGAGSQILAQSVIAAEVILGEACIVNHGASVDHECVLGDGVHVAPGAILCGCINVGDCAFIGAGAIILPRIKIGHDAIVGAGAVVTEDVPSGAIVIGVPAKILLNK